VSKQYPAFLSRWIKPLFDPKLFLNGIKIYPTFIIEYFQYKLQEKNPVLLKDCYPQLHDRTKISLFDSHYYYSTTWAFKKVVENKPDIHLDIASYLFFSSLLSNIVPVIYFDYRPLFVQINNLFPLGGNISSLPFGDNVFRSISCLHVIEHIGLGRYGDKLDALGTEKAIYELKRILNNNGNLFLCMPVGKQRICFNAHRIHSAEYIIDLFNPLLLEEFSGIDDHGQFHQKIPVDFFEQSEYACGLFWFKKHK
jgi:SAM-dependent methyltransferase